jgi:hypothetical protein
MKIVRDYAGREVRLTDERLEHILEHPEMREMKAAIDETLQRPERVVESRTDRSVQLYYRLYFRTIVGGKFLCVVVKTSSDDAFVITAYLTDRIKKGRRIWPKDSVT